MSKNLTSRFPDLTGHNLQATLLATAATAALSLVLTSASIYLFLSAGRAQLPEPLSGGVLAPAPLGTVPAPPAIRLPGPVEVVPAITGAGTMLFGAPSPSASPATAETSAAPGQGLQASVDVGDLPGNTDGGTSGNGSQRNLPPDNGNPGSGGDDNPGSGVEGNPGSGVVSNPGKGLALAKGHLKDKAGNLEKKIKP